MGVLFVASNAALKMAGTSSRLPLTSLMVSDLAASALADAESGFRVSARIVKECCEVDAMRVSTSFLPCFPVAPSTRSGFDVLMAVYDKDCNLLK